ncbi:MAG: FMN-binding protein [Cetobacterium sp.]
MSKKVLPKLIEEAKIKNSADIDSVAGATYTSDVFKKALKAALENTK